MNEGSRKTALVFGAVAAAAGLAIASYLYVRLRASEEEQHDLRDVTEILNDCYEKMKDLQSHIGELEAATPRRPVRRRAAEA